MKQALSRRHKAGTGPSRAAFHANAHLRRAPTLQGDGVPHVTPLEGFWHGSSLTGGVMSNAVAASEPSVRLTRARGSPGCSVCTISTPPALLMPKRQAVAVIEAASPLTAALTIRPDSTAYVGERSNPKTRLPVILPVIRYINCHLRMLSRAVGVCTFLLPLVSEAASAAVKRFLLSATRHGHSRSQCVE